MLPGEPRVMNKELAQQCNEAERQGVNREKNAFLIITNQVSAR